jgi:hypothetical protein
MKRAFAAVLFLAAGSSEAAACSGSLTVYLETFGQGVTVELRNGTPGKSKVFASRQSSGGTVQFDGFCKGSYFLAIGNGDSVDVAPVHQYDDGNAYESRIRVVPTAGNISKRSRNSL